MAREERDQLVDAGNDLVGDAEVGEAVVRVVDAASGREVRLEAAQLDLKGLVEEGTVYHAATRRMSGSCAEEAISSIWVSVFMSRRTLCN